VFLVTTGKNKKINDLVEAGKTKMTSVVEVAAAVPPCCCGSR
jgi:hypothetical protein